MIVWVTGGMVNEQTLTSLAIIKVNWDRGRDYIENFVPFAAECLRTAPQAEVSLPNLQIAVKESFGLQIPQGALKTILGRVVRWGFAVRTSGIYVRNEESLAKFDFSALRADALRQQEALIERLRSFAAAQYKVEWSKEQSEYALLACLANQSAPILAAAIEGQPIVLPVKETKYADFVVNAFVAHALETDPEGFNYLESIVKGSMLANALLFPELGEVGRRFDRVEVYFDTTFLLRALGLSGPSPRASCQELLDLLYGLNARLRCFSHTFDEVNGVLEAALTTLRNPNPRRYTSGESIEFLVSNGYKPSDIELIIASLEQRLRTLRIELQHKPPHNVPLGVDEAKLRKALNDAIHYQNEEALNHDVESLTAIHRLRHGRFPKKIESCDALFVTTNTPLASTSTKFFREDYNDNAVPVCITDQTLTTLAWLKRPTKAPDLPRKRIIADCFAALNPPDKLWRSYLKEIDRLRQHNDISAEDFHLIRYSTVARRILMDVTMGDADAFAEGTPLEVLERARAAARAETEEAYSAEKENRLKAERAAKEAQADLELRNQAQYDRIHALSVRIGRWASRALLICAYGVIALGTYATLPRPFPELPGDWLKFVAPALLVLMGILSAINLIHGMTLISLIRRWEVFVAEKAESALLRELIP